LTEEAIDILKNIDGPIGLVAVAGMYRTGKSYLLNRMLLNRSNGFGVGPSINPCTKVWIPDYTNNKIGIMALGQTSSWNNSWWRNY
jgi:hypothetical protein